MQFYLNSGTLGSYSVVHVGVIYILRNFVIGSYFAM